MTGIYEFLVVDSENPELVGMSAITDFDDRFIPTAFDFDLVQCQTNVLTTLQVWDITDTD